MENEDNFENSEQGLKALIESAYKKLRSYVYYDNSNLFIRQKIVEKEGEVEKKGGIDYIIETIYNLFVDKDGKINEKEINIKENDIDFNCLPKAIKEKEEKNDKNIITNNLDILNYNISKVTYFIDIDLEYHILGTLWVMLVGDTLIEENDKHIYGNILEKNINKNNIKLFKPYYKEYSKWRDNAISCCESLMDNNTRNLMITLDIKDYYYSVNINFDELEEVLNPQKNLRLKNHLLKFDVEFDLLVNLLSKLTNNVKNVLEIYTKKILSTSNDKCILPIGYMPSTILANWYLKDFDKDICEKIQPVYYGRYIDDILIVIPFNNDEPYIKIDNIINKYFYKNDILLPSLCINNNNNKMYLCIYQDNLYKIDKYGKIDKVEDCKKEFLNIINLTTNEDIDLIKNIFSCFNLGNLTENWRKKIRNFINNKSDNKFLLENLIRLIKEFCVEGKNINKTYILKEKIDLTLNECNCILIIQNAKIKIYDFQNNGSRALIQKFKNEIKQSASVFRFLPEKDEVLGSFDQEVLQIIYSEGINKIRSIEEFKINKYNLSKFLSQVIYSQKSDDKVYLKDLNNKILNIFLGSHIIEFYNFWEKALMCFVMNDNKKDILKLIHNTEKEINQIDNNKLSLKDNVYIHKNDIVSILKKSLHCHLNNTIALIWALNDDLFIDNDIEFENKEEIEKLKENYRKSNMLRHNYVREPLFNYTNLIIDKDKFGLNGLNLMKNQWEKDDFNIGFRCSKINEKIINNIIGDKVSNENCGNNENCAYNLNENMKKYTPRFVHLHEIILYNINKKIAQGEIIGGIEYIKESICEYNEINGLDLNFQDLNLSINSTYQLEKLKELKLEELKELKLEELEELKLEELEELRKLKFIEMFSEHVNDGKRKKYEIYRGLSENRESNVNLIKVNSGLNKDKLKIAIVHMDVNLSNCERSIKKVPNLNGKRLEKLYKILNDSAKNKANMIIFPEISIPYSWLSVMSDFSRKHNIIIICGLEHIVYENGLACNYIAIILPGKYNKYTYSIVKLRLKNHYAPSEVKLLKGYGLKIPKMKYMNKKSEGDFLKEYDLFRWNGIDFSCYNCFELASLKDRGLFMSYIDLLIGSEYNRDTNYYSNIIESLSRDVHCYFAQVNNSRSGDNRIVAPKGRIGKNILQITGGQNDTFLIGEIDIKKLREFQLKEYNLQQEDKSFKPTPPEFDRDVLRLRMKLPL